MAFGSGGAGAEGQREPDGSLLPRDMQDQRNPTT